MEYETSLRLMRLMWHGLHIKPGAVFLGFKGAEEWREDTCLPAAFCALLGHHGARGWFAAVGRRIRVPAVDLRPLGRWKPKETPEDYARDNRTGVLQMIKKLTLAVKEGCRIDESLNVERAVRRGGPAADVSGFCYRDVYGDLAELKEKWVEPEVPGEDTEEEELEQPTGGDVDPLPPLRVEVERPPPGGGA